MKVVHLSTNDIRGGAARAAYRIHEALQTQVDSWMVVNSKESENDHVLGPTSRTQSLMIKAKMKFNHEPARMLTRNPRLIFSNGRFSSTKQLAELDRLNPDVVNLHWINDGLISIERIAALSQPVVWTVHDMWPFTGGCHYTEFCENYKVRCGSCPQLKSSAKTDLSTRIFNRKKKLSQKPTFVAPSKWMKACIESSALFQDCKVHHIPYPIDLGVFKPRDKSVLRDLLKLPQDKQLVLFGAENATVDQRKGFKYLKEALDILATQHKGKLDLELVVFGSRSAGSPELPFPSHFLGKIKDDTTLAAVYGACDVFAAPSVQDNLPNTVIESLASGVPAVAFNIGGMPDMIESGKNGFLAEAFSSTSYAEGILSMLEMRGESLIRTCRATAESLFDPASVAGQYHDLYRSLK